MLWTLVPVLNTCVIAAVNSHSLTSLSLMLIKKKGSLSCYQETRQHKVLWPEDFPVTDCYKALAVETSSINVK